MTITSSGALSSLRCQYSENFTAIYCPVAIVGSCCSDFRILAGAAALAAGSYTPRPDFPHWNFKVSASFRWCERPGIVHLCPCKRLTWDDKRELLTTLQEKRRQVEAHIPVNIEWPSCSHNYTRRYHVTHKATLLPPDELIIESLYQTLDNGGYLENGLLCPHYAVRSCIYDMGLLLSPHRFWVRGITHATDRFTVTRSECRTTIRGLDIGTAGNMTLSTSRNLGHGDLSRADPRWISQTNLSRSYGNLRDQGMYHRRLVCDFNPVTTASRAVPDRI
jgi:hypothetical protein